MGDQGVCAVVGVDKARLLRLPVGEGDGVAGVGPGPASLLRAGFVKKAKMRTKHDSISTSKTCIASDAPTQANFPPRKGVAFSITCPKKSLELRFADFIYFSWPTRFFCEERLRTYCLVLRQRSEDWHVGALDVAEVLEVTNVLGKPLGLEEKCLRTVASL